MSNVYEFRFTRVRGGRPNGAPTAAVQLAEVRLFGVLGQQLTVSLATDSGEHSATGTGNGGQDPDSFVAGTDESREAPSKVVDGNVETKWADADCGQQPCPDGTPYLCLESRLQLTLSGDFVVDTYELVTAMDNMHRDPTTWTFGMCASAACENGGFVMLSEVVDVVPPEERSTAYPIFYGTTPPSPPIAPPSPSLPPPPPPPSPPPPPPPAGPSRPGDDEGQAGRGKRRGGGGAPGVASGAGVVRAWVGRPGLKSLSPGRSRGGALRAEVRREEEPA